MPATCDRTNIHFDQHYRIQGEMKKPGNENLP
jgi:hypothetical protein